ncbi:MAG: IPT/TIG domain-containing protein [Isosphaeraceae bacterium]
MASNSSAIINNIISQYGNGHFHPDFGQDTQSSNPLYGIPYNVVHGNTQPKVHVVIDGDTSESDLEDAPIPSNAVIEGDDQNGPVVGANNRGDSHLIVWDEDNNIAYEFYYTSRPSENSDGQWHAAGEAVWNMNTNTFRPLGWTSADAAGLAILPGLVRPDEALPVSQGGQGVINHAIRMTLQNNIILDQYLYPASHVANPGITNSAIQPPMGARLRLKANVDISGLDPESRVIAQAMKDYGLIVADNGSNFFITGASYSVDANNNVALTWDDNDIQSSTHGLKSLTFSDFEVVDTTPIVTGLSASSDSPGSSITITGQNFSGAAGQLQVLFGSTAATNVTLVDDSHVTAVVPAGTGTVDVRVQSGVTEQDSDNIKNPIFGYGISAVTSADRFTYGDPPPTQTNAATFISSDTTTQGNWKGHYGKDGYNVIGKQASYPSYATVGTSGTKTYVWKASTTDTRGLQVPQSGSTTRTAACWYSSSGQFTVDINLNDGQAHRMAIYACDWDSTSRSERIDVVDPTTHAVLDSRTVSSFHGGVYLSWQLKGHVQLVFTRLSGANPVVSGLFFG